jgi:DNA-directed RNA polymerase subunit RPC12/RpoP
MPQEKYYCGNCGATLYYGAKFKEHTGAVPCSSCGTQNPVYFLYCYRCGQQLSKDRENPPSIG